MIARRPLWLVLGLLAEWIVALVIVGLILYSASRRAHGAHVPPHPLRLSDELLVGRWAFSWGGASNGWIAFNADGTYVSQNYPPEGCLYAGRWWVEREQLVLLEWVVRADGSAPGWGPMRYDVALTTNAHPRLVGRCGSLPVILSEPKR